MLGSMFLVICYYFVILLLKNNKEVMIRKNFLHPSLLFWAFFLILGYASFNLMSHFINVEFNCKDKIIAEATHKIKLVASLSDTYKKRSKDDVQNFDAQLKTKLTAYKTTKDIILRNQLVLEPFRVNNNVLSYPEFINVEAVANAKVNPYLLKIGKNNQNIQQTILLNSKKYQSVFDNWKRLSLMKTYTVLNEYVVQSSKLINSKIEELPLDKTPIVIPPGKKLLPLNNPAELNKLFPPNYTLPLIIVVILHIFILIPFFSYKVRGYKNGTSKGGNRRLGTIEL
jgi:hypothetical protein